MSDFQHQPTPPDEHIGGWPTPEGAPHALANLARHLQRARRSTAALADQHRSIADRVAPVDLICQELDSAMEELLIMQEELRARSDELRGVQQLVQGERMQRRELLEVAPVAYLATDTDGAIRDANQAAGLLFEVGAEALIGQPLMGFVPEGARRRFRRLIIEMRDREMEREIPLPIQPRTSAATTAKITVAAVRDEHGSIAELHWLIADNTDRETRERDTRAREAAEQASDAKSELLATVSHELRTPLAAIGGYADLLSMGARGNLTEPQLADVMRIRQAQMHLSLIVDDLLSFTKLGAGRLQLELSDILLSEALSNTGALIAPQAELRAIRYELDGGDGEIMVRADGERLRQIIINLLSNAVKFTRHGGSIHMSWRADSEHVSVVVTDDGVGIDPSKLEAIFQPFVQLRASGRDVPSGTGLGLAISRSLARAMGGDLIAASEPGQGSSFTLRLPKSERLARGDTLL